MCAYLLLSSIPYYYSVLCDTLHFTSKILEKQYILIITTKQHSNQDNICLCAIIILYPITNNLFMTSIIDANLNEKHNLFFMNCFGFYSEKFKRSHIPTFLKFHCTNILIWFKTELLKVSDN